MGKLKQLEIENFKSYAGKQLIGPFDDFTCIIGPNGSGKSNLMDAISFVLGVQSKHLRSSQLKDLIYRKDLTSPPARKAIVRLVYQTSSDELQSGIEGSEIVFSRAISSAGVTSYQIDSKDVTYEIYERTLSNIGVLVKARNFLVFQGDIESMAQKSPADLSKLIEQISGSELLRDEYNSLLTKKNEMEENILLMMQKKKLFVNQKKEVKDQKDEAQSFLEKQNELDEIKSKIILFKIFKIKNQINDKEEIAKQIDHDLEHIQTQEPEIDDVITNEKIELAKSSKKLQALEKDFQSEQKKSETNKNEIARIDAKLSSLQRRQNELQKTYDNIGKDVLKQKATITLMESELNTLNTQEQELKNELLVMNNDSVQFDENNIQEYLTLREEAANLTAAEKTRNEIIQQDIKCLQLRLTQMEKDHSSSKQELEHNEKLLIDYETRLTHLKHGIVTTEQELNKITIERENAIQLFQINNEKLQQSKIELDDINIKLSEANDDQRRSKHEVKEAEAIDTMKRIFSGVHGKLIDLCRPHQKKYAQAVAVAAGRHMDAIVVETKQVASDCINYLKDQRVGSCMFLPLDNLKVQTIPERLRNLGPKFNVCYDLLDFDEKFKPAVAYAVGSTIVCDTLEDAQELCFVKNEKVKVVTIKGHVIGKTGAMTGGSSFKETNDRWREKELDQLRQRKTELEDFITINSKTSIRQHITDLENTYQTIQSKLRFSQAEYEIVNTKITETKQQIKQKMDDIKTSDTDIQTNTEKLQTLTNSYNDIQQGIDTIESRIFSSFSDRLGIVNIRDHEERTIQKHQYLFSKIKSINERKTDLLANLEYETKKKYNEAEKRVQDQMQQVVKDMNTSEKEKKMLIQKDETMNKQITKLSKDVNNMKNDKNKHTDKVKEYQIKKTKLSNEKESLLSKLSIEEIGFEKLRAQLHEILQKSQIEEISLPTVDMDNSSQSQSQSQQSPTEDSTSVSASASSDRGKKQAKAGRQTSGGFWNESLLKWEGGSSQSKQLSGAASSQYSVTDDSAKATNSTHFSNSQNMIVKQDDSKMRQVDLSSIENLKITNENQINKEIDSLETKLSGILTDIQNMQPNMHATERYEGVLQKLQETTDDLELVKRDSRQVTEEFEEIKTRRKDLFHTCYQHISESLSVIYRDLTRSSKHPLGGNAFLTLDNTEEPYLGGVRFTAMPPMKRFRDMDQLSGGEKTMAALALLFSIHSFRQAPFFVLDEVDAALDNVNVKKICNYIRQRSKDFQCLVISLKDMFFENADMLVGVCRDVKTMSSQTLTLDMKQFDNVQIAVGGENSDEMSEDDRSAEVV